MKKVLSIVSFLLIIFVFLVSSFNIFNFYSWYKKKPLDIIVDIDYFIESDFDLGRLYDFLSEIKIDKVAFSAKDVSYIPKNLNFLYVLKFFNDTKYKKEQIVEFSQIYKDKIFSVVYLINDYKKTSDKIKYLHHLILKDLSFDVKLNFENYHYYKIYNIIDDKLPLRTFVCDLNLYRVLKIAKLKIKKAAYERSCVMIYIIPSEYLSVQENLDAIYQLSIYINNKFGLYKNFTKFKSINLKRFSNLLVFLSAVILPLFFYDREFKKIFENTVLFTYIKINFLAILIGILIWGFLESYDYISLEKSIYGIRLMFILPLIFSFLVILDKKELIELLNYNIKVKDFLVISLSFIVICYLILRIGNVSSGFIFVLEIKVREFIENFILFRPRFKEFLFAQPLLYLSIFLIKKRGYNLLNKIIFCFSILTFSSIINTFLHVHTPLHICILRSIAGIILGLFFSYIYILSLKLFKIKNFS